MTTDEIEAQVRELERLLGETAGRDDPVSQRFRDHAQPLVDVYRGRRSDLSAHELLGHGAGLTEVMLELGSAVRAILERVSAAVGGSPSPSAPPAIDGERIAQQIAFGHDPEDPGSA